MTSSDTNEFSLHERKKIEKILHIIFCLFKFNSIESIEIEKVWLFTYIKLLLFNASNNFITI